MHRYYPILKSLSQQGIDYVAIGTWALKQGYPEIMGNYPLTDCDIVIPPELTSIHKAIRILKADAWRVTVWENPVDEYVEEDFLKGKYYLRARKQDLVLDLTYECPLFSWEDLYEQRVQQRDYFLGSLVHILALKKAKGREKDLETISLFNQNNDLKTKKTINFAAGRICVLLNHQNE